MAHPYIPPPSLLEHIQELLPALADEQRAVVTFTVDRGERGHMTMTFDGTTSPSPAP